MKLLCNFKGAEFDSSGRIEITFTVCDNGRSVPVVNALSEHASDCIMLDVRKAKNKRSLDANAMLWACLSDISNALSNCGISLKTWDIYLYMIENYGQFEHIKVRSDALADLKKKWRNTKVVGSEIISDKLYYHVICFYGSSTYDSAEFSKLLNGVIAEMNAIEIQPPEQKEVERSLALWDEMYQIREA